MPSPAENETGDKNPERDNEYGTGALSDSMQGNTLYDLMKCVKYMKPVILMETRF